MRFTLKKAALYDIFFLLFFSSHLSDSNAYIFILNSAKVTEISALFRMISYVLEPHDWNEQNNIIFIINSQV